MRIVAAMSGGVDSSVTAALLAEAGHDVIGVSMQLYDQSGGDDGFGSCCSLDDLQDARRVAGALGIPYYIVNLEEEFRRRVVDQFVRDYTAGRTPLPCVHCNSDLKFAALLERAAGFGAKKVATGHYARVEPAPDGLTVVLRRGIDAAKDQSYFLFSLTQAQLACALFPLGGWTKDDVRRYAHDRGLRVAAKPDSQELCFVPDGDYAALVERLAPGIPRSGVMLDERGHVIGRHGGTHRFTIGQRKGLGLSSREPLFVTAIDAAAQTVTVGPKAALERVRLTASRVNWIAGPSPAASLRVDAQIRYRHSATAATVTPLTQSRVEVRFDTPQSAITPGQAVVFYRGDEVLGGGWID